MQTLIIYDNTGTVRMTQAGDIDIPQWVQMAVADIPDGQYAKAVDPETGAVTLEEIPQTDTERRISELEAQVAALTGTED